MNPDLIYLAPGISFGDILNNATPPIEWYRQHVRCTVLEPVTVLESDKDRWHGVAALSLLLTFFEPHGKYLLGTNEGSSKTHFTNGCEEFFGSHAMSDVADRPAADKLYRWARCGLFHSAILDAELLIDATGQLRSCFGRHEFAPGILLLNPWDFARRLNKYLQTYCDGIATNSAGDAAIAFNTAFKKLVLTPLNKRHRDNAAGHAIRTISRITPPKTPEQYSANR